MALTKEQAKARSILDVAHSLGMEMKRISSQEYYWTQHDSLKINVRKNRFSWYSRDIHGDVIDLVRTIKNLNYKEAMHFLDTGDFPESVPDTTPKTPFEYRLGPYEESFVAAYDYLREQRGLSDETISFFGQQGGLAQARYRHEDGHIEPVLVFKYFDQDRRIVGASLQGILPDQERHEGKGYLKKILYNSDGLAGLSVDVGQPNRLVFAEAPIDLMSYYELNKDRLENVRLVAMEGLKEQTISRYFMELYAQLQGSDSYRPDLTKVGTALETAAATTTIFKDPDFDNFITLAIDNDEAGLGFIEKMTQKGIKVVADLPPLEQEGQKMDWNDYLKDKKGQHKEQQDNSRLAQAKRKLERLENELVQATQAAFVHQAQTNGQPMNDKRGNSAFFKRRDQLEDKAIALTREIESQKERIEDLEWQEERKERGLNRKGSGLDMSVANIPRIREEIERFYRGESFYTRATIKNYEKKLVELEAMAAQQETVTISLGAQYLIDQNLVNQWAKQPSFYFVQGQRGLALQLQEDGTFALGAKYRPKTPEQVAKIEELLDLAKAQENQMAESIDLIPEALSFNDSTKLKDLGQEKDVFEKEYFIKFSWSESIIDDQYQKGELVPYKEFVTQLYQLNDDLFPKHIASLAIPGAKYVMYEKTQFDVLVKIDGELQTVYPDFRYDIGSEVEPIGLRMGRVHRAGDLIELDKQVLERWQLNTKKSLEETQGIVGNAGDLHRSPDSLGEGSPGAASKPVEQIAQPDFPVITPLKFSTRGEYMSTIKQGYHVISPSELSRLNKFAPGLQSTAQWYLKELADSKISYFYKDGDSLGRLQVEFSPENFAHLAGISPKGVEMKQVVHDFAQGKGAYGNIQVSNAIKDKSMVLPLLPDILSSQAFVFDDLSTVEKFHRIDLSQAVKTEDEDLLLAIRDLDGIGVPASLMKFKEKLAVDLIGKDKIILGVYRERDGQVTQLSVNDAYIKDGGREMMAIMAANLQAEQAKRYDVIQEEYQLDSDGDGISNADEIRLGTDPHNANSRPGREEESKVEKIDVATVSELIAANDTKGLSQHLREGMRSYLNSDRYKEFLTAMSKFHNYSPQNIALILAQNPEATMVASYQKWQKDFKRQVQKGEKGLKIRVPMTFTLKDENGQPKLDENGQEIIVTRFKLGTVFDVSQTKGEDLPRSIYNLTGDVIDYENLYRASRYVSEQNGVPVTFEKIDRPNAYGFHDPINSRIVLADKQMSEAQIMKTLFHEMAHSDLHKKSPEGLSRSEYATHELQAESVAYVVASHYGIDTSEYSFAYLTSWAKTGDSFERFEEQLKVVQEEAKSLITRIDQALELIKRKELTQDKFQSKLSQAQAKQTSLLLTKEGQAEEAKKSQDMSKNLS